MGLSVEASVVTRLMRILACCFMSALVLSAGCGEDKGEQYFRELDEGKKKGSSEVDTRATGRTAAKPASGDTPQPARESTRIEINEVPPAKLVGTREVKENYADGTVRVVRQVKLFTDDSTVNHGNYVEWHPNGKKFCEGAYLDGRRKGSWTFWFDNGRKAKVGSYLNGRPDGEWTYWQPDGSVDREEDYKDSKRDGRWVYYNDDGKRSRQAEYKVGMKHGIWIRWHDDEQMAAQGHYVDDKLDGTQTAWYKNGQMASKAAFSHGKRHGKVTSWNELGDKTTELLYEKDVLVKRLFPSGKL